MALPDRKAVRFFECQFQRQVASGEAALNPFEQRVLPYVKGSLLDLGCGLGNLSLEAAARGCRVVAVDASATAVARLRAAAAREGRAIEVIEADLTEHRIEGRHDTVVAIGILMFFGRERALELLKAVQDAVLPGGIAAVTVLVEGTTFMEMFDPRAHYLFAPTELEERFAGWEILESAPGTFPAPGDTVKVFSTVVARRRPA